MVYSSTAACAAANLERLHLIISYLHKDWSTFRMHSPHILHVLHAADSCSLKEHSLT